MSTRSTILKGGVKLGFGQTTVQACSFARSVIIARLISPQNFGIAALFATTFSLFEMASNLSAQTLLVQAKDGHDPHLQTTAHFLQVTRGFALGVLIFVLAGPLSRMFGVPQARWAFQCLALGPLFRGLTHLDTSRLQRDMRFGPSVTVDVSSAIVATLAAFPLAFWLRSYSAMLWLLILQAGATALGSHLVAERSYGWAFHRGYVKRIFDFGWPLLINGILMFGIFEGDRFIIGASKRLFERAAFSLTDLGVYSVAFSITWAPAMFFVNVTSSLFLPVLSRAQENRTQFERRYLACAQICSLVAAAVSMSFILAGGGLVVLVYGQKYAAAAGFIGWLSAMWALRIVRVAPTLAAMAFGDTRNAMVSNIARTSALLGMLAVAATGHGVVWIAVCGFVGESIALVVCVGRLDRQHGVPYVILLKPFAVCAGGMAVAAFTVWLGIERLGSTSVFVFAAVMVIAQCLAMFIAFPGLRREMIGLFVKVHPSLEPETVAP